MSYKDDSRASTFNSGVHVAKTTYPGRVFFPSWDSDKYVPTIIRPFGPTNDEQTEFLPWRFTNNGPDYSQWIESVTLFRGGTRERVTFVANQRNPDGSKRDPRMFPSPASILIEAWSRGQEEFTHWKALGEGGKGRSAAMPDRLQTYALIQAAVLEHNGKEFYDNPILPAIVLFGWSAMVALESELDREVEGYDGDPEDANARYVCGDLLSADGGKLLSVFNSKTAPGKRDQSPERAGRVSWGNAGSSKPKAKDHDFERPHYAVTLTDSEPLPRAEDGRILHVAQGLGWRPWFDDVDTGTEGIIQMLSDEEQVQLLCRAFEDMPDLLIYAFEDKGLLPQSFYDKQRLREANRKVNESRVTAAPTPAGKLGPKAGIAAPAAKKKAAWGKPAALPPASVLPVEEGETTAADAADEIPMVYPPEETVEGSEEPGAAVEPGEEVEPGEVVEPGEEVDPGAEPEPSAEPEAGETPEDRAVRESAGAMNILQQRKAELDARKKAAASGQPAPAQKAAVKPAAAPAGLKPAVKPAVAPAGVKPAVAPAGVKPAVKPAVAPVGVRPAVRPAQRPGVV